MGGIGFGRKWEGFCSVTWCDPSIFFKRKRRYFGAYVMRHLYSNFDVFQTYSSHRVGWVLGGSSALVAISQSFSHGPLHNYRLHLSRNINEHDEKTQENYWEKINMTHPSLSCLEWCRAPKDGWPFSSLTASVNLIKFQILGYMQFHLFCSESAWHRVNCMHHLRVRR